MSTLSRGRRGLKIVTVVAACAWVAAILSFRSGRHEHRATSLLILIFMSIVIATKIVQLASRDRQRR